MVKNYKKIIYVLLMVSMLLSLISCGRRRHKWVEKGAEQSTESIAPGVHPERGSISDATPIETAIIYVPLGIQEKEEEITNPNGSKVKVKRYKSDYRQVLYDLNEITPESVDMALKDLRVLGEDSEFHSLEMIDDNDNQMSAGPGGAGIINKKGLLSYVDYISSPLDNSDNYKIWHCESCKSFFKQDELEKFRQGEDTQEKDKCPKCGGKMELEDITEEKELKGRIAQEDIVHCLTETFAANFHLTSCEVQLVGKNGQKLEE